MLNNYSVLRVQPNQLDVSENDATSLTAVFGYVNAIDFGLKDWAIITHISQERYGRLTNQNKFTNTNKINETSLIV